MKDARSTQRVKILKVLISARGDWVPLPTILELKISQFGARIFELRRLGVRIVYRTSNVDGVKHSWYRLDPKPPKVQPSEHAQNTQPAPRQAISAPDSLFGDLSPEPEYPI